MAAQLEMDETNGPAAGTITHGILNANMGDLDTPNLATAAHPIIPGGYSMAKYHKVHVVDMVTSSLVDDIRIWQTGALGGSTIRLTNLKTSSYGGALSYAQPVAAAITGVNQNVPTSLPISANLGIGGDLAGSFVAPGFSDYFIHELLTDINDVNGGVAALNIQYGEVL